MVPKTAESQLTPLEKENIQLKKELANFKDNNKIDNFIRSIFGVIASLIVITIFATFAEYGAHAYAFDNNMSVLGGALLVAFIMAIGLFLKVWIVAMFVINTLNLFKEDIIFIARKAKVFIKGGLKTVQESIEVGKAEEPVTAASEPMEEPPKKGTRAFQQAQNQKIKDAHTETQTAGDKQPPAKSGEQIPLT